VALRKAARGDLSLKSRYLLAPGSSPLHPSLPLVDPHPPVDLGSIPAFQIPRAGSK
jgi:hypothetical protein